MTPELWARVKGIAARIHEKHHGDQCADIHPVVHAAHLAGFEKKALLIVEAEIFRGEHKEAS